MTTHFIEMGQGVIAHSTDAVGEEAPAVCTSPLHSCTFISGYNKDTGKYGAYHYPANCLLKGESHDQAVENEIKEWKEDLKPTSINLVFAKHIENQENKERDYPTLINNLFSNISQDPARYDEKTVEGLFNVIDGQKFMSTSMQDAYAVWKMMKEEKIPIEIKLEANAAMVIKNGALHTGNPVALNVDTNSAIDLKHQPAGVHGVNQTLTIIGKNRDSLSQQQPSQSAKQVRKVLSH